MSQADDCVSCAATPESRCWSVTEDCLQDFLESPRLSEIIDLSVDYDLSRQVTSILEGRSKRKLVLQEFEKLCAQWKYGSEIAPYYAKDGRIVDIAMPPMFNELLACHGIDGDVAFALSCLSKSGLSLLGNASDDFYAQMANIDLGRQDHTWITLGSRDLSWRDDCLLMPQIPHSMKTSLIGKPLKALFSHTVLDKYEIAIVEINDVWSDDTMIEVVTDLHAQYLGNPNN